MSGRKGVVVALLVHFEEKTGGTVGFLPHATIYISLTDMTAARFCVKSTVH